MLHVDSEGKEVHQTVALQRRGDFFISLRNVQVSNNHCSVLLSLPNVGYKVHFISDYCHLPLPLSSDNGSLGSPGSAQ